MTESLSLAYLKSRDCGLSPVWVEEEEVTGLTPTKTDVFVMDPFEGPAFEYVTSDVKFKCTILGKYEYRPWYRPITCNPGQVPCVCSPVSPRTFQSLS